MQKGKVGAIVQARTSSTRLPNKVLKELPYKSGITVLEQVIRRLKKSNLINIIIIATTNADEDIPIIEIAEKEGVEIFRGSKDNVLERYYLSARTFEIDTIVRITSDCPCIDFKIVDMCVSEHINFGADYTANNIERTFPYGLDVEVVSFNALETAFLNATEWYEKEHVVNYILNAKNKFKLKNIRAHESLIAPNLRVTIDTIEDYALLCAIFDFLYFKNNYFGLPDIISLFKQKPWLELINIKVFQKKVFDSLEDELNEAIKIIDMQDLKRVKELLQNIAMKGLKE